METKYNSIIVTALVLFAVLFTPKLYAQLPKLKVSGNGRFLVKADGTPFVWIGDTNWFFSRLPPSTIDSLLHRRSQQGFTVLQVSCRENLYNGQGPGSPGDPNEAWWSYLDDYVNKCEERGLYVAITLGWWGITRRNSEKDLYQYGKWVGNRYKDHNNIIWLTLGEAGSHSRKDDIPFNKLHALVKGIREGDTGNKLLSVHADYQRGSSLSQDGEISDFNNWQTSQWCCPRDLPRKDAREWTVWEAIQHDYDKLYDGKPKPTLDAEAWYENNKDFCGAGPFQIRRRAYFTLFAGAFGHTYGAGGIWDGLTAAEGCSRRGLEAIHYVGAQHMGYLSNFLHRLGDGFLSLRPEKDMIVAGNSDDYDTHLQAARAQDGSFALIYSADDAEYTVDLARLAGQSLSAAWYNPRTDTYRSASGMPMANERKPFTFDPPGQSGPGYDWVLILGEEQTVGNLQGKKGGG